MLVSGGAAGSDVLWAAAAAKNQCGVNVKSFTTHKVSSGHPASAKIERLPSHVLGQASDALRKAARHLGKSVPDPGCYTFNLLARNYFIVKDVPVLFAVARLTSLEPSDGFIGVEGGTGWGCQIFTDRFLHDGPIPLYVHSANGWYQCHRVGARVQWRQCPHVPSPLAFSSFGGIGTRTPSAEDSTAISSIF
jgi:hypothetical protein